jgi:hypothetical protein
MMQQHMQMLIARPMDCPGAGSGLGIPRLTYSLPSDFAIPITTKKFQIKLKNGMSESQTIPGSIVLEAGAHLIKTF